MDDARAALTLRQYQALLVYCHTRSQKMAARQLGINWRTFHRLLERAYVNLGVHDEWEAFLVLGWLVPPPLTPGTAAISDDLADGGLPPTLAA